MTYTFTALFALIAVLIAVAGSIGVFMLVFNKRIAPDILLFFVVAAAGSLVYMLSGRDLSLAADIRAAEALSDAWAGRLANTISLGLCLVAAIQIGLRGPVSRISVIIIVATLQYYFVCFLMPAGFDRWFEFDHKMLYPVAALVLVAMPSLVGTRALAVNFARAASIPAALSILMIIVDYKAAVLESYQSLLPFFTGRLYGATPHPNTLGAVSAFATLLLISFPPAARWERYGLLGINLTALLLSQSKTSWLTLLLAAAIMGSSSILRFRGKLPAAVYVLVFVTLAAGPAVLSILDHASYNFWAGNKTISDLSTLTGRTDIWQATLALINTHLTAGPGWATYEVYMQSLFPTLVPNPHNVYLATLVQAGIVGAVAFAVFIGTLIIVASTLQGRNRLFALAYIAMFCVRGLSESDSIQAAFSGSNFWTVLMAIRLIAVSGAPPPPTIENDTAAAAA